MCVVVYVCVGYFQGSTCVTFIYICSCVSHFSVPGVVWLLHLRILISLRWCSTPGLSCGQIAALFISLVINITHCTATFAGNNTDNGATVLLSLSLSVLFFSLPHCCGESHFCEQQAHRFYLQAIWIFTHFFPNLISSMLNGAIFSCRLRAATAFQSGSTAATCTLHNNHVLLWLDASLAPDVTAVSDCPSTWCRWTKLLYWDLRSLLHLLGDMN